MGQHGNGDRCRSGAGVAVGDGQGDSVCAGHVIDVIHADACTDITVAEGPLIAVGGASTQPVGGDVEMDGLSIERLIRIYADDDRVGINGVAEAGHIEDGGAVVTAGVTHPHCERVPSPVEEAGVRDVNAADMPALVAGDPADDVPVQPDGGRPVRDGGAIGGIEEINHDATGRQSALGVGLGVDGHTKVLA